LGSASLTTNNTGGEFARQSYFPYGAIRAVSGVMPTKIAFTGQYTDDTGLMYFNARYYNPLIGRFVSADTIVPQLENPQAWNRYSYVVNNSLKYTDPSGHCFIFCVFLIGASIGAMGGAVGYTAHVVTTGSGWDPNAYWASIGVGTASGGVGALVATGAAAGSMAAIGMTSITSASGTAATAAGVVTVAGSSVVGGQAARATANVLTGSDIGEGLGKPEDIALDALLGLVGYKAFGGKFSQLAPPPIKPGAAGGPTAGKQFPPAIKAQAEAENPLKMCVFCRRPGTASHVDHAIPASKGGNATIENAQLACPFCNQSKGNRFFPVNPPPGYRGPWPPPWKPE
jgi:RHS repeat-associated protein